MHSYHTASLEDYSIVSMNPYARIPSYIHFILSGGSGVSLWVSRSPAVSGRRRPCQFSNSGGSAKKRQEELRIVNSVALMPEAGGASRLVMDEDPDYLYTDL